MLNCKEVSKLVSKSLDDKVTLWQRMNMWMHLAMCGVCWGFRKNLVLLQKLSRQYADAVESGETQSELRLPDDARQRIRQKIEADE